MGEEQDRIASFGRLEEGLRGASPWYWWGPYVSERQWGTVREDYSADGDAWSYLPHDDARSSAYRWGEDGLAGFSDIEQRLCLGLSLWNGADPILKERIFGLTGVEGNHGEDAKEYWWYTDALPSHAWNVWRYHYPQAAFPYDDLVATNRARTRLEPEYELLDTGVFDEDRYFAVEVRYAKADPTDLLMEVEVTNVGPERAELHLLPTAWFRNTWSWGIDEPRPRLAAASPSSLRIEHPWLGELLLHASPHPGGAPPTILCCENETNAERRPGGHPSTAYPKDGINDHVLHGARTVNPSRVGTKAAFWYQLSLEAGETQQLRLRLRPADAAKPGKAQLGGSFRKVLAARKAEADEFYADLTPASASADEAAVLRQGFAGMLWTKQLYYYNVEEWLQGDPGRPAPPAGREQLRNQHWRSFNSFDIMSMPDKWEYPWFAAWDLAFHCVALARVDPAFAKYQLSLLCREWFQHPSGALPAYEWDFSDVNPPVQAWAALEVFAADGAWDYPFLSRIFDKLLVNFTWWVNREDPDGDELFGGGFLGLDNIGPIDRSHLPPGAVLRQADATGWMGFYALSMGIIASFLLRSGTRHTRDLVIKFLEHFTALRSALSGTELFDEREGFYFDELTTAEGASTLLKVFSMAGVIPLLATMVLDQDLIDRASAVGRSFAELVSDIDLDADGHSPLGPLAGEPGRRRLLLGMVEPDRLLRVTARLFDEEQFLSPHGLRSLSARHRDEPFVIELDGVSASIDYEPAESTTPMFGGNSNWRGPVWYPLNVLAADAFDRLARFYGEDQLVEYPTGSGQQRSFHEVAQDLRRRLVSVFLLDDHGRRPCFGEVERFQRDPRWRDQLLFFEYFNGDDGAGLGASHQTGWTGLAADQIIRLHGTGALDYRSLMPDDPVPG